MVFAVPNYMLAIEIGKYMDNLSPEIKAAAIIGVGVFGGLVTGEFYKSIIKPVNSNF